MKRMLVVFGIMALFLFGCAKQTTYSSTGETTSTVGVIGSCGFIESGNPNFAGTPREGDICYDDVDCQLHPPAAGKVNCCEASGKCY